MEIILTVTQNCEGEGGNIKVVRADGQSFEMGTIKFEDGSDKRWLLKVLMDYHPHVKLSHDAMPCDPSSSKPNVPC